MTVALHSGCKLCKVLFELSMSWRGSDESMVEDLSNSESETERAVAGIEREMRDEDLRAGRRNSSAGLHEPYIGLTPAMLAPTDLNRCPVYRCPKGMRGFSRRKALAEHLENHHLFRIMLGTSQERQVEMEDLLDLKTGLPYMATNNQPVTFNSVLTSVATALAPKITPITSGNTNSSISCEVSGNSKSKKKRGIRDGESTAPKRKQSSSAETVESEGEIVVVPETPVTAAVTSAVSGVTTTRIAITLPAVALGRASTAIATAITATSTSFEIPRNMRPCVTKVYSGVVPRQPAHLKSPDSVPTEGDERHLISVRRIVAIKSEIKYSLARLMRSRIGLERISLESSGRSQVLAQGEWKVLWTGVMFGLRLAPEINDRFMDPPKAYTCDGFSGDYYSIVYDWLADCPTDASTRGVHDDLEAIAREMQDDFRRRLPTYYVRSAKGQEEAVLPRSQVIAATGLILGLQVSVAFARMIQGANKSSPRGSSISASLPAYLAAWPVSPRDLRQKPATRETQTENQN